MDHAVLPIYNTVPEIHDSIGSVPDVLPVFTKHFAQSEDFFLKLDAHIAIPSLPIHHSISKASPSPPLRDGLAQAVRSIAEAVPGVFHGLQYFFQPQEPLKPSFYQLHRCGSVDFLYLVRLDLGFRPHFHTLVARGNNDASPAYTTRVLFLEADLIPLRGVHPSEHGQTAVIRRSISDTWVGETGRGYFVQGIWIDQDLTKFFSKLFLPGKSRLYPFFPFTCKYQAITQSVIDLSSQAREQQLLNSQRALGFLEQHIAGIQTVLRQESFSPELELYRELRSQIPDEWRAYWRDLRITPYLNEENQKEFSVCHESYQ